MRNKTEFLGSNSNIQYLYPHQLKFVFDRLYCIKQIFLQLKTQLFTAAKQLHIKASLLWNYKQCYADLSVGSYYIISATNDLTLFRG